LPTLGKVMHTLGFSLQRSLHHAWEQDAALWCRLGVAKSCPVCWPALSAPEHSCNSPMKLVPAATTTPAPPGGLLAVRRWCARWALA
jgi:hypothetical protein